MATKIIPHRFSVLCLFLGLCSAQVQSADLIQIYQQAREADPQFKTSDFEHQASREILTQAKSGYLPSAFLDFDQSETHQEILESDNAIFDSGSTTFSTSVVTLSLTQPVFRYANYVRIKQAHSELKQADAVLINAEQELMLRVTEKYIDALAAEDNLAFLKAEQIAVKKQLQLVSAKEKAKLGRISDRLEAEASLASVAADYSEAEVNLQDTYEALAEMTGEYPATLSRVREKFPLAYPTPSDVDHWVEAAVNQNWELKAWHQASDVSRKEIRKLKAEHYPTLDLKFQDTIKDTGGSLFGGGSKIETQEIMLSLNIPLFQGGLTSSKVREAALKHKGNLEESVRLLRKVKRETKRIYSSLINSIQRIEALEKEVKARKEVLEFKRAGYKAALATNLSVLDAERDLYSAKQNHSRARYDYLLNSLKLKAIVGTLSKDDLASLNNWLFSEQGAKHSSLSSVELYSQVKQKAIVQKEDSSAIEAVYKVGSGEGVVVVNKKAIGTW